MEDAGVYDRYSGIKVSVVSSSDIRIRSATSLSPGWWWPDRIKVSSSKHILLVTYTTTILSSGLHLELPGNICISNNFYINIKSFNFQARARSSPGEL